MFENEMNGVLSKLYHFSWMHFKHLHCSLNHKQFVEWISAHSKTEYITHRYIISTNKRRNKKCYWVISYGSEKMLNHICKPNRRKKKIYKFCVS